MNGSTVREDDNNPVIVGREPNVHAKKTAAHYRYCPNMGHVSSTQTTYCTLPDGAQPHIRTNVLQKSRKLHTVPTNIKTENLRRDADENSFASKLCQDTKGSYCGLLSEYARGSIEYTSQNEQRNVDNDRARQKFDQCGNLPGAISDNNWKLYHRSK